MFCARSRPKKANKNLQQRTLSGFITIPLYYLRINSIHIRKTSLFPEKDKKKITNVFENCLVLNSCFPIYPHSFDFASKRLTVTALQSMKLHGLRTACLGKHIRYLLHFETSLSVISLPSFLLFFFLPQRTIIFIFPSI